MIKIINFPFCNFHSLERYLRLRKKKYLIVKQNDNFKIEDIVLIPGVGTFGQGMSYLRNMGIDNLIKKHAEMGGKIVGICLGMQLLFNGSEESPSEIGLSVLKGFCRKIPQTKNFFVPHIGWNSLSIKNKSLSLIEELEPDSDLSRFDYYFVHSYYVETFHNENILANFDHPYGPLTAVVNKNQILGFQFHPEKSGKAGYYLLDRVL